MLTVVLGVTRENTIRRRFTFLNPTFFYCKVNEQKIRIREKKIKKKSNLHDTRVASNWIYQLIKQQSIQITASYKLTELY
jgi:hypothetical protein